MQGIVLMEKTKSSPDSFYANNFTPFYKEDYYTVNEEGIIVLKNNLHDKLDMFNMMMAMCFDSPFIKAEDIKHISDMLHAMRRTYIPDGIDEKEYYEFFGK